MHLALTMLAVSAVSADAPAPAAVPEALRSWIPWALKDREEVRCPFLLGKGQAACLWPSRLALQLDEHGGKFTQEWSVLLERDGFAKLPGDNKHWPLDVTVDGKLAPVLEREGSPSVVLGRGTHTVAGRFSWDSLPESLQLPAEIGLVDLLRNGMPVAFTDLAANGQLNLQREAKAAPEENRLTTTVTRLLNDDVPFTVVTQIELEATGKSREEILGPVLLPGTFAVQLDSPLPLRLEPDGRLVVQVRQGTWTLKVTAYRNGPFQALALPPGLKGWPEEEVWAFEAQPVLREVTLSGLAEVDPERTRLPAEWKHFPAYRALPNVNLKFTEQRRGDPTPAPDHLELRRSVWLDFDGDGFTVRDDLNGQMHEGWRLALADGQLGHVVANGRDQLITTESSAPGAAGFPGFEVRQGNIAAQADSRLPWHGGSIPAVGWAHDMKSVSVFLNLPPGWRLFHALGVDSQSGDFITQWTLLDFFFLLIVGIAAGRLLGPNAGLLALVTLGLTYHEADSPRWLWLVLLAVQAVLQFIPEGKLGGRLQLAFKLLRIGTVVALSVILVSFWVTQLREAIHPSLEVAGSSHYGGGIIDASGTAMAPPPAPPEAGAEMQTFDAAPASGKLAAPKAFKEAKKDRAADVRSALGGSATIPVPAPSRSALSYSDVVDNEAVVQTGPGVPSWKWRGIPLGFSGPVAKDQEIRLWLIPPWLDRLLAVVRVALTGLFLLLILRLPLGSALRWLGRGGALGTALAFALLLAAVPARADFPDDALLKALGDRLAEAPKCQPNCGSLQSLALVAAPKSLELTLTAAAAAPLAFPLPGARAQWSPTKVTVDGQKATLRREADGGLWVALATGVHKVVLEGPLPPRDTVQLSLPLSPHYTTAKLAGWTLSGLHEDGAADSDLQLSRIAPAKGVAAGAGNEPDTQQGLSAETLPPFARVQRTLQLGLTWNVHTTVTRDSPPGTAVVLEVPLLPGESVVTGGLRVANKKALVNLGPTDTQLEFDGKLEPRSPIALVAPTDVPWTETWVVDASSIWHVEQDLAKKGIAPIHEESGGRRLPEWRPWPGESVALNVTRPAPVAGQSLTIDSSTLDVTPGQRQTDAHLTLTVRTSRGGQEVLTLPEGAKVESLTVGGRSLPVPGDADGKGRKVSVALVPGSQQVDLKFTQPTGISASYRAPAVDLGTPSVNSTLTLNVPADRWVLWLHGPALGPAVLFYGVLLALLLAALALSRIGLAPLRAVDWFLLGAGFTQTPVATAAVFAAFLLALGARQRYPIVHRRWLFNLIQLGLVSWAFTAAGILVDAVKQGLLGEPEMQIEGNNSYGSTLHWFLDRAAGPLPTGYVLSVPLWIYRLAMLAWALWLALACVRWAAWAWRAFSEGGFWKGATTLKT